MEHRGYAVLDYVSVGTVGANVKNLPEITNKLSFTVWTLFQFLLRVGVVSTRYAIIIKFMVIFRFALSQFFFGVKAAFIFIFLLFRWRFFT